MEQPAKKTRLTDRKREAILRAAAKEFQENGFDRAKMDRIAEIASVSKRTVYNHFESKEELFVAIMEDFRDRASFPESVSFASDRDPRQQLLEVCEMIVHYMTTDEFLSLARVIVSRFLQKPELAKQTFEDKPVYYQQLTRWLKAAGEAGVLKLPCYERVTCMVLALLKDSFFWPVLIADQPVPKGEEAKEIINEVVDLIWDRYQTGCN